MSRSRSGVSSSSWKSRRRWTADDARAALAAQERSGLAVAAFAAREGMKVQRLTRWSRLLEESARSVEFVEVASPPAVAGESQFEVVLRSGQVVRVPEMFDAAALRRLVAALEEVTPC
jgi:hypothetical protein